MFIHSLCAYVRGITGNPLKILAQSDEPLTLYTTPNTANDKTPQENKKKWTKNGGNGRRVELVDIQLEL